jgi:hypothetical protein
MKTTYHRQVTLLAALLGLTGVLCAQAQVKLEGNVVTTPRLTIAVDKSGLPAQIAIKPEPAELPYPLRAAGVTPTDADLQGFGRGPQLRAPVRLQAVIGGQVLAAEVVKPAAPAAADGVVACQSELQAGALRATLRVRYGADGGLQGELVYGGQNVEIEKLELILDLAGDCDTLVAGAPVGAAGATYPETAGALGPGEGVVWKNVPDAGQDKASRPPGVLTHAFLGSGDRGFTWLTPGAAGFSVDEKLPTMLVERDKQGAVTWRIAIVNTPTKAKDPRTVTFALLVHPAKSRPAGRRVRQWTSWTGAPAVPALEWAARKPGLDLVRADAATVHEAVAARALLEGSAGGDAASAAATLADTFPIGLFRYLAAPHTGLAVQLRTNAGQLASPGASPACDRMALGRALLHDIGLDARGLGQRAAVANLVRALDAFGYFKDDGKTEFLPYWRSGGIVRYGETFTRGNVFEVTEADPMSRARVSVFLRPSAANPALLQALFVVVNEGDTPAREQFYVLKPDRLFGGPNALTPAAIIKEWDFAGVPEDSDWRRGVMVGAALYGSGAGGNTVLKDLEDGGYVQLASKGGGMEIYGKLFVPARGFRVLLGTGAP